MPIVQVAKFIRENPEETCFLIEATDLAFEADIKAWCEKTHNKLSDFKKEDAGHFVATIEILE